MARLRFTLIALALALTALAAQLRPGTGYTPVCTAVLAATPVLDGWYFAVDCPQGRLTVSRRPDQPTPVRGPARVVSATDTTYDLVDPAGQRYRISR